MPQEQITHIVLDLFYTPDEGQECFCGTIEECNDFVVKQSDFFMYKVVPLTEAEYKYLNSWYGLGLRI